MVVPLNSRREVPLGGVAVGQETFVQCVKAHRGECKAYSCGHYNVHPFWNCDCLDLVDLSPRLGKVDDAYEGFGDDPIETDPFTVRGNYCDKVKDTVWCVLITEN